jgi:hypothetical protein
VDFCNPTHTDDAPQLSCESSAVTVLQRGQAIEGGILVLITSYREITQYSKTIDRIRDLMPKLSFKREPYGDLAEAVLVRDTMNRVSERYDSVVRDLRSVIDLAVVASGEANERIANAVKEAYSKPNLNCASSSTRLYYRLLDTWFS